MSESSFYEMFSSAKPIIGMVHLSGSPEEKIGRALQELELYDSEGLSGAIIENYNGSAGEVVSTFELCKSQFNNLVLGVNILGNPYYGFDLALRKYDNPPRFIQFDSVEPHNINVERIRLLRDEDPHTVVLGGVGFKYTRRSPRSLETELQDASQLCDAIVTTGVGTGSETPLLKLVEYKNILSEKSLSDFPLIVGAGVTVENVYEQLSIADGAIVGSYFKEDGKNTKLPISRDRVRMFMDIAKGII